MKPFVVALALVALMLTIAAPRIAAGDPGTTETSTTTTAPATTTVYVQAPTPPTIVLGYAGHTAKFWHDRTVSLHRELLHRRTVAEALNLACAVYGHCAELWRKASCESKLGRYLANASSSARGLLQFLTRGRVHRYGDHALVDGGTWATTPFWRFDVESPYANALAAGWMLTHGRGNEWSCR